MQSGNTTNIIAVLREKFDILNAKEFYSREILFWKNNVFVVLTGRLPRTGKGEKIVKKKKKREHRVALLGCCLLWDGIREKKGKKKLRPVTYREKKAILAVRFFFYFRIVFLYEILYFSHTVRFHCSPVCAGGASK